MAEMRIKTAFVMSLDVEELRLVLKALGGRLKPEDIQPAQELGDRLTFMRATQTRHVAQEMDKLLENLVAATTYKHEEFQGLSGGKVTGGLARRKGPNHQDVA